MRKQKIIKIKNIKAGDMIIDSKGNWSKVIDKTKVHKPKEMFRLFFTNGYIECSGDHQWTLFKNTEVGWVVETNYINENIGELLDWKVGSIEGPRILSIKRIKPKSSLCITTDTKDQLFEVILKQDVNTKEFNVERDD